MNKLVVAEEKITIDNQEIELICNNNIHITCCGDNTVIIQNKNSINIEIVLNDYSSLKLLIISLNKNDKSNIYIEQNNNTFIEYKEAFISKNNANVTINNTVKGNKNKSIIKIRGISKNNDTYIDVLANVLDNTKDNEIIEDIKGINHGGTIFIQPNMEINTADVIANHYVTIGDIDKNSLFYLEAKGINKKQAEELILNGFLKSIFRDEKTNLFGGE